MTRAVRIAGAAAALLAGAACSSGEPTGAGGGGGDFSSGPSAVVKVEGDGQNGPAGRPLTENLEVAVVNDAGAGVPDVRVVWTVTRGGGEVSPDTTFTDGSGRAETRFTLGPQLGRHAAQATAGRGSSTTLTVTFGARATVLPIRVEGFTYTAPDGSTDVTVEVGDTVLWENTGSVAHTATASTAPAGGRSFDSGRLAPGDTFRFVPQVQGSWTYRCTLHPDSTTGGKLTAR